MDVVVIGAGQAGLAVSRELTERSVRHTVLEAARVGQAWRERWESFTLVTPNWTLDLPGSPYDGGDPEGHVPRDEIVAYLQSYAARFGAPIREGVRVDSLRPAVEDGFRLMTSSGEMHADVVVVCTGAYQRAHRPAGAGDFPAWLTVLETGAYREPDRLPPGKVLIVGSGQTGCQLAEELHLAGRDVFLSCGRAPWAPRRLDGLDIVTWIAKTTFMDQTLAELPNPAARLTANVQATGARGGHDLHYRVLQALGVTLLGRLSHVSDGRAYFVDDLAASVAFGDARWADLRELLRSQLPHQGIAVPDLPEPLPFRYHPIEALDMREVGSVIITSGFRPDYSWIEPNVVDDAGFPLTVDGASTVVRGLYFCGVHFMRTRRSSLMFGVGADAAIVAESVAATTR
ncbi:NAD(P)/FAD-dependent oxidoreductase [Sinomonas sp. ASV322]|uniref:flavin-containing monooxygenase n=1 Tax=Sinomonas sp. ASV322 TaxID=3041920 RepID=UPI0027DBA72D|nr:NAD(P)/FAD-dependent oxidoreductase [Sinomonas sp. ASV322]MDQ4503493.1 NAD(P)/FAD-dependent oxidoreductase [Sinomonas sp. ASV322]